MTDCPVGNEGDGGFVSFDGRVLHPCNRSHETVAVARIGDDEAVFPTFLAQHLAERRDTLREIVLFHRRAMPDLSQQFVLRNGLAGTLHQHHECRQRLGHQGHSHAGLP